MDKQLLPKFYMECHCSDITNFNDRFDKLSFELRHEWVITSHCFFKDVIIHPLHKFDAGTGLVNLG